MVEQDKATPVTPPSTGVTVAIPQGASIENLERISLDELIPRVSALAKEGWRLVTLTACDIGGAFEVLYHFDRDLVLSNLSITIPAGQKLPSITGAYLCAFLVENEIADLFGLEVEGLPIDFHSHLVLASAAAPTPLLKQPRSERGGSNG
ncbi:MAG: NADH-quinone oxidoreductase subunit C [Chloroflexota bacterium]